MAGRGRGRGGWRGGRGGRGGGAAGGRGPLTDEDGNAVAELGESGPPKLFPVS